MTDSPETRLLLRLQTTGSNTNTWGGYLDTNQQMLSRASKGYQAIAMTGDQTISWTNYSLTNIGAVRTIKLTGSLSAVANLVVPSLEMDFSIINSTGQTITAKTSAGTGIGIPNGGRMNLYCDGTDVYQSSPTNISAFTPADNYDLTTKTYVDTAIAAATTSTTPGTLRVTASDTTSKFLATAVTTNVGTLMSLQAATLNAGANEQLSLTAAPTSLFLNMINLGMTNTAVSLTATANTMYRATAQCTITLGTLSTNQIVGVARDSTTATITVGRSAQTIDGVAANFELDIDKQIILFLCNGSGTVVTRKIGDLPT